MIVRRLLGPMPCSAALLCLVTIAHAQDSGKPRYSERWVYCSANLQVERSADEVVGLIERSRKAGYTGMMIADYKLNILDRVPDHYFKNVAKVKRAAEAAGIELIPAVCSIGYSNGYLAHNPNLAEGLPVVDQPFIVAPAEVAGRLNTSLEASAPPGSATATSRTRRETASSASDSRTIRG